MIYREELLFDTYRVLEEIGSGGGGIVYKAYHERLKKYVVIKQIRDCVKGVLESRAEVDILKNLSHTYLPQVFDFLILEDNIYTVLDYIPGISLEQAIKEHGGYDEKTVLKWANQLAEALAYLHSQKPAIIHSDIKPANIMLKPNGDICLIDFNVSLAFDAGMRTSTGVSRSYSPPEQYWNYQMYSSMVSIISYQRQSIQQRIEETVPLSEINERSQRVTSNIFTKQVTNALGRGVDERSDIYSLGATLYHLLTGSAPTENFDEIIPISRTSISISEGFAHIIEKMMEITPTDRYQNGMELVKALQCIYELDSVYRKYRHKRLIEGILITALYVVSAGVLMVGVRTLKREQMNAYHEQMAHIGNLIDNGNFSEAEAEINAAIDNNPMHIDAYLKKLECFYYSAEYEKCIQYGKEMINSPEYQIQTETDHIKVADVYYLLGNAYYEADDLANASSCFLEAIKWNNSNAAYYRDYSIALAKSGNLEKAEEVLKEAVSHDIGKDSLYLSQGEIAFAADDYEKALEYFEKALSCSEDEQVIRRCVLLADRTFIMLGEDFLSKEIMFLEKWENRWNSQGSYQITERLANAYARNGVYDKAINKINGLINNGFQTFQTMINLSILYQQIGETKKAEDILKEMRSQYPDRYETYKRLAFLEADKQQIKESKQRDYHMMKEYYDQAVGRFKTMNLYDDEMQTLDILMQDVQEGHWLD